MDAIIGIGIFFGILFCMGAAGITVKPSDSGWENRKRRNT